MTLNKKEVNPRISRWALELQNYDYQVEHRSGSRMQHVDALSRANEILVIEDNPFEVNLSISQGRDSEIKKLRDLLEKSEHKHYEMRNGLVYRKLKDRILFYVPQNMIIHVMRKYHDELGHLALEKTYEAMREAYWFPNMKEKVKSYIQDCLKCIAFNPVTGKAEGFLHSIPKGNSPFITIHIDHYGPKDKTHKAKQHILVVIDSFTKFTKLYAVKSTGSKEVIECLEKYFRDYSRPRCLVSDRGSSFTSKEFVEFLEANNVKQVLIATASPKANGQVERVNRVLGPMIGKLVDNASGRCWYKVLADVEFALNNSVHKSTGETPAKLMFGMNQRGKIADEIKDYLDENIIDHSRDLETMREKASEKIIKSQEYNKKNFDKKRKEARVYKVDDYVMVKNYENTPGVSHKLIPSFKGPYRIVRVLRNDRYVITDVENHQVTQRPYWGTWEANNLRPWGVLANSTESK